MSGTKDLLRQARQALVKAEREQAATRERHRRERAVVDGEVRRLKATLRALTDERQRPKRSAAVQAGPKAMETVLDVLASGPHTQAEITRLSGLNDGSVSYAVRALVEAGRVEATGVTSESGSREFRLSKRERSAA